MNQVRRRKLRYALAFLLGKSVRDGDVLSLNPSMLAQLLAERLQLNCATGRSTWIQVTDASDFPWLLRVGGKAKRKEHGAKRKAEHALADN
jgi:hypothetical protein